MNQLKNTSFGNSNLISLYFIPNSHSHKKYKIINKDTEISQN